MENESGLSHFIPVLIGDKETCTEMKVLQQRLEASLFPGRSPSVASGSPTNFCNVLARKQKALNDLVLDIAWLLKNPALGSSQQDMSSLQLMSYDQLFGFLIEYESTTILERLLQNLKILMDKRRRLNSVVCSTQTDMVRPLQFCCTEDMTYEDMIYQKYFNTRGPLQQSENSVLEKISGCQNCYENNLHVSFISEVSSSIFNQVLST